jgi:hypothetical protein
MQSPYSDEPFYVGFSHLRRSPRSRTAKGHRYANEIEARDKSRLGEATDIAAEAIAKRFGPGSVDGKIQAHVVTIEC